MVAAVKQDQREHRISIVHAALESVVDPEIPVLSIAEIGMLREVRVADDGAVEVVITPTYSGCPAMNVIALEIELVLARANVPNHRIVMRNMPAWTTDWISVEARRKLREYGIAPPATPSSSKRSLFAADAVICPKCGSAQTERVSEFGSTSCKAHYRCKACLEPFDYFKCI